MICFQVRGPEVLVQRVLLERAQRNQVNKKKKSVFCEYGPCPFCLIWSFIEILRISWNRENTRNFGHTHPLLYFVALLKDWQSDLTFLHLEWQQENRTGSMSTVVFVFRPKTLLAISRKGEDLYCLINPLDDQDKRWACKVIAMENAKLTLG